MATRLHRLKGEQFFDDDGAPLAGGKLTYYEATTTNLQNTYSEADGLIGHVNANPITLDSAGRLPVSVYFGDSASFSDYKELLTDALLVTVSNWPIDNLPAAESSATAAAFAPPLFNWTQVTNAGSPVALTAANAGNAYEADTTSGNVEFDLPSAASVGNGKGFLFKKTVAANSMIIDPNGTETIDNSATSLTITQQHQTIGIFSNGAEWYAVFEFGLPLITLPTVQRFTSGSGTYTPAAGTRRIRVRMVGGGGGGGAATANAGIAGGNSSFASWTAIGGGGGPAGGTAGGIGGTGGATGTGTLVNRVDGAAGGFINSANGGQGGSSVFGGAGPSVAANSAGTNAKANTGSGGGGGAQAGQGGGGGAGEYVEFFVSAPTAVSYAIGAAGTGGAAGTQAGGNGAAGVIIVEEYY